MSDTATTIHVLHVGDEPGFADVAARHLERVDDALEVPTATDPGTALALLADRPVDCVVSDYEIPGMNGIELLETVREGHLDPPFVRYTDKGSEAVADEAVSKGVTDYLLKESGTDQYTIPANRIGSAVDARRTTEGADRRRYRLEQVLKAVPSCVVQLDAEGRFVHANDRAVEVLGLEESGLRERVYNDPGWRITDPSGEAIPDEELPFRQVEDSGEPLYGYRHTVAWPDGTEKMLRSTDSGYSTGSERTGFGLAIGQETAHAHGWSVAVVEGMDGGAQFEVTGVEPVD